MKEPEIIKAINNLQGITEDERQSFITIVNNTFYYNADDYYIFAEKLDKLDVKDVKDFFSNLSVYLEARSIIDEKLKSLSTQNFHAKASFRNLQEACTKLRLSIREITSVKEYVKYIMDTIDGPEIQAMVKRRDGFREEVKAIECEIDEVKADTKRTYDEANASGKFSKFLKAVFHEKSNKRKIEKINRKAEPKEKEFGWESTNIVRAFNDLVSRMPEDKKDLLMKYKDLVGYEHFFAIKADFNWYLHNGEIGRLQLWLDKLSEVESKKRSQLAEELEDADSLKKKIDARDEVITNFGDHSDLFGLDPHKKAVFESYTKRYPGLNSLDADEIFSLNEQSDARVLYGVVPLERVMVKSLKRER